MTITARVQSQYFVDGQELIRLAPAEDQPSTTTRRSGRPWTGDEHNRFLAALEMYPSGPWKLIAAHIGTRTTRQTMTHAQKYREKIARRRRMSDNVTPVDDAFGTASAALDMSDRPRNSNGPASPTAELDDTPYSIEYETKYAIDDAIIALLDTYEPLELTDDGLAEIEVTVAIAR